MNSQPPFKATSAIRGYVSNIIPFIARVGIILKSLNISFSRQKPTRLPYSCQDQFGTSGNNGCPIGGGNIVRGAMAAQEGMDRVQADYMGMLGTVINALAVQDLLEHKGVDNRVMTAIRMDEIAEPYIRRRALRHMERGRVVLFAGGTGNPYFSTDTAAVLRAIEMESDVVIKATKVEGVFTADPAHDSSAEFIPKISFQEVVARELAVMDAAAGSLCKENSLPIIVLDLQEQGAVAAAIRGEPIGTLVS